jgi:hypothetical protein
MSTKVCSGCGSELPATLEFYRRREESPDGMLGRCRSCVSAYNAEYRSKHLERRRAQSAAWADANREHVRESNRRRYLERRDQYLAAAHSNRAGKPAARALDEWRSKGCAVCGEDNSLLVQSHHIDPAEKETGVTRIADVDALERELKKCIPLCANHHILFHNAARFSHRGQPLDTILAYLKGALA